MMRPHHLLSIYAKRHELARTGEPVASPLSRVARGDGISLRPECAATGGVDVPPRYLRPEAEAVTGAGDGNGNGEAQIPIIDHRRLLLELDRRGEESSRLHRACQDWGFFQVSWPRTCLCIIIIIRLDFCYASGTCIIIRLDFCCLCFAPLMTDVDEREVPEHRAPRGGGPRGGAAVGGGVPLAKHPRH